MKKRQLRWMKLDNSAKLYPATKRRDWSNIFRLSITLDGMIDPWLLQEALNKTVRRFPSIAVRVRAGAFWYYLEEIERAPRVKQDHSYPLTHMPFDDIQRCAFRVLYYKNRIAVEFFHAIADGNSGLIFLKTLTAKYLELSRSIKIPCEQGVFDVAEQPREEELRDDFLRYAGKNPLKQSEATAYQLKGTPLPNGFRDLIIAELDVKEVLDVAHKYKATLTELLVTVMIQSFLSVQAERVPPKKRRPVKVLVPNNLRRIFPSETLRNFVLYVSPGIDPKLGDLTFEQMLSDVHHQMALELTPYRIAARIRSNVGFEQMWVLKLLPLFLKNIGMKIVYNMNGEKKTCITMSNLGAVKMPQEMAAHVQRVGFTLGTQHTSPNNRAILSFGDKLYIELIRSIQEPVLEQRFITNLRDMGLHIKLSSNYGYGGVQ